MMTMPAVLRALAGLPPEEPWPRPVIRIRTHAWVLGGMA